MTEETRAVDAKQMSTITHEQFKHAAMEGALQCALNAINADNRHQLLKAADTIRHVLSIEPCKPAPAQSATLEEAREIIFGFMESPDFSDWAPHNKSPETLALEDRAMSFLSRTRKDATNA